MTITEFLLSRIAEDEAAANNIMLWRFNPATGRPGYQNIAPRVLAECEAKRKIVAEHEHVEGGGGVGCTMCHDYPDEEGYAGGIHPDGWCTTLRALAAVYSDHQDYDPEWKS